MYGKKQATKKKQPGTLTSKETRMKINKNKR